MDGASRALWRPNDAKWNFATGNGERVWKGFDQARWMVKPFAWPLPHPDTTPPSWRREAVSAPPICGFRALTSSGTGAMPGIPQNAPVRLALPRADLAQLIPRSVHMLHRGHRTRPGAYGYYYSYHVLRVGRCCAARELKKAHARSAVFADRADTHHPLHAVIRKDSCVQYRHSAVLDWQKTPSSTSAPHRCRASTLRPVSSAAQN